MRHIQIQAVEKRKQIQRSIYKLNIMTMSKEMGKLEEEALKRKERLKNLKRKFDEHKSDPNGAVKDKPAEIPK